jgi:oxygen-dependent protoporphyrinogen oxidase
MKVIIVGAGISGLSTAHALLQRRPDLDLQVLEADSRLGGKVWTDPTPEGYICEGGVNGFLSKEPKTLQLAEALDLAPETSFDASRKRFVYRKGKLHALPESPPAFLTSGLMSPGGRLRVFAEPFIRRGSVDDETLSAFATRRLGREAAEALIDPMASGVFAGNSSNMSLKSCFPRIHEVEQEFGSLIRGLITLQRRARKAGKKNVPGPGPGGKLTSFAGGMGVLTDTLASKLGDRLRLSTPVEGIERTGNRFHLQLRRGVDEADLLIMAIPAWAQAGLLRDLSLPLADLMSGIPYPSLSVCCFGYDAGRMPPPMRGFGFLVPSAEQRDVLGTVEDSSVFPGRAPEGAVLLRSMVGGARASEKALLPDGQLIDLVRAELKAILGVDRDPDLVRIYRHLRAIPQYMVGHSARLAAIDEELKQHAGLVLTGNAFHGVSLNDCVANADRLAERLLGEAA